MNRISKACCSILLASTALTAAHAQEVPDDQGDIIVTGTRSVGTQVAESAAPIQLLTEDALSRVGQPNLNQALTQIVPSFQAQTQGTDMASFSLSARLRGISPNHTLLLVNGKRRHSNAILQVINGAFGGSAAPSLDLIPTDAIQRVEIFQEGAAAIYGSDAIAGVINLILKSNDSGATVKGSIGQYYDGEGMQYSGSGNFGLPIGDSGFLNVTLFHRRNDVTTIGEGQFTARNLDGSTNSSVSSAFRPIYDALNARDGTSGINGGQPKSQLNIGFFNAGYDAGDVELYAFGDVSYRHGDALQGFRPPNRVCASFNDPITNVRVPSSPEYCFQPTVAGGMVPHIEVKQEEFSLTGGAKGDISGWTWDLAVSYSEDVARVFTTRSANAAAFSKTFIDAYTAARLAGASQPDAAIAGQAGAFTPRDFYDGKFVFTQFTSTLDITKDIDLGMPEPVTLAFGGEYRRESYEIGAGDELSRYFEGGQSFPGYGIDDAGKVKRNSKSGYLNFILHPLEGWTVDIAGRVENYSDFGTTTVGKLTTRYDFSDAFAVRGTISTGFRAPSLQEQRYSANSVGPTQATLQVLPGTPASLAAGFGALRPEKSTNISLGTVIRPVPKMVISLDGYYIKIRDRIVSTGSIRGQRARQFPTPGSRIGIDEPGELINGLTPYDLVTSVIRASGKNLDQTVIQSGDLSIQTYTNGIDTETWGAEFSARYPLELDFGMLDLSLGVNYNDTKVVRNGLGNLFNLQAQAIIEQASPKWKGVFGALFTSGGFAANMRATYYSKTVALVTPNVTSTTTPPIAGTYYEGVVDPAVIFDLELAYDFTESVNVAIGANNLFNKIPEIPPLVADYDPTTWPTTGRSPYINGSGSINAPYNHGPYSTSGGYYYARLTFKF